MKSGKDLYIEWGAFIRTEDPAAFQTLYEHYYDYLAFIGLKRGAESGKIKDCINELFLGVFENRGKLQHVSHHHNYLVTSFLRKLFRKERPHTELDSDMMGSEVFSTPSVEVEYISQASQERVTNVLSAYVNKLSESQARLIYQKFYLGLSYEEIAASNQISVKTAYNTVYNAVDRLRKLIGKENMGAFALAVSMLGLLFLFFLQKA